MRARAGVMPNRARNRLVRWDWLANPVASRDSAYVPRNGPAIGDLMNLFQFGRDGDGDHDHDHD